MLKQWCHFSAEIKGLEPRANCAGERGGEWGAIELWRGSDSESGGFWSGRDPDCGWVENEYRNLTYTRDSKVVPAAATAAITQLLLSQQHHGVCASDSCCKRNTVGLLLPRCRLCGVGGGGF